MPKTSNGRLDVHRQLRAEQQGETHVDRRQVGDTQRPGGRDLVRRHVRHPVRAGDRGQTPLVFRLDSAADTPPPHSRDLHATAADLDTSGDDRMTLREYLTILRRRWPILVTCALVAAAVMWVITPAQTKGAVKAVSYTATATLLVGARLSTEPGVAGPHRPLRHDRGDPRARRQGPEAIEGDPALLASQVTVTPDPAAAGPDDLRIVGRRRPGGRHRERLRGRNRPLLHQEPARRGRCADLGAAGGDPDPQRDRWRLRRAAVAAAAGRHRRAHRSAPRLRARPGGPAAGLPPAHPRGGACGAEACRSSPRSRT